MPAFAGLLTANIIDTIIIITLVIYLVIGLTQGFLISSFQLTSYIGSAVLAFKFTKPLTSTFAIYIPLPAPLTTSIIFLLIILASQYFFHKVITNFEQNISHSYQDFKKNPLYKLLSPLNHLLGSVPAFGQGVVFSAFIMCLILLFASSRNAKFFVLESKYGDSLVESAAQFELSLQEFPSPDQTLIRSKIDNLVAENIERLPHAEHLTTHEFILEQSTLESLNKLKGATTLTQTLTDPQVSEEARKHADDIFARGYASHYNNEGDDLPKRLDTKSLPSNGSVEHILFFPEGQMPIFDSFESTDSARLKQIKDDFLSERFKELGIGIVKGVKHNETLYVFIFTAGSEETPEETILEL